jgi:DNA/RNA-binding domain of Phe-tRNA-synthetase-like protein
MNLLVTERWRSTFPAAHAGFLALEAVLNPAQYPALEQAKRELEQSLRARWAGHDRKGLETEPVLAAYAAYYRAFQKSYHVRAQLESVAFKGKPLPTVATLVEAMFMAELKNGLLTAGHDLDRLSLPVAVDVSDGTEAYTVLRGQAQVLKGGDMFMADRDGVISSILYGPDQRTAISARTTRVLFTVYAPAGIEASQVEAHLGDIADFVRLVSPGATTLTCAVLG